MPTLIIRAASAAGIFPTGLSGSGISGTIAYGNRITISGSGFGSGSTVVLFDDFEDGVDGEDIGLTSPYIGSWSSYNNASHPTYSATLPNTGSLCMFAKNAAEENARTLNLIFSARTEFFMSFWRKYSVAPTAITVGQCKETWMMDGPGAFNSSAYDMCWPTRSSIGGTSVVIAGNDFNQSIGFNNMWYANEWARFAAWGKSNGASPMNFFIQSVNQTGGYQQRTSASINSAFFGSTTSSTFDRVNVPGYYSETGWSAYWDNFFFATNPARVEVGDSSTYTSCRRLHIVPHVSWSSTQIEADIRSDVTAGDTFYVFDDSNTLVTQITVS